MALSCWIQGSAQMISDRTIDTYPLLSALKVRRPTPGQELAMVSEFLERIAPVSTPNVVRTVFVEPRIESGFPDVVIVEWDVTRAADWPSARSRLKKVDIKFLHRMYMDEANSTRLENTSSNSNGILRRLEDVGIIQRSGMVWKLRPLRDIFAVERLIAIEAKINSLSSGLRQAMLNTWFTSESYLLLPKLDRDHPFREEATRFGVRVLTSDESVPNRQRIEGPEEPRSYVSWLFNEWAWRASLT